MARIRLLGILVALALAAGCVSLSPASLPTSALDAGSGNGWQHDATNSSGVEGGWTQKRAVEAYLDDADDGRGHPGRMSIVSIRTLLSPDREELRDRVETHIRDSATQNGLEIQEQSRNQGQRTLANEALSFYVAFNATAEAQGSVFASNAEVRLLGEVFRCTGGPTVIVTGSAQISEAESVGGFPTGEDRDARTWAEIVRDPAGTIEGHRGQGLIYRIQCGG